MIRKIGLMTLLFSFSVMAATPIAEESITKNEDLQFLANWKKEQKFKTLAGTLALSPDQMNQLKAMRAEVDRVKERFEAQKLALKSKLEGEARVLRQQIETNGDFQAEDRSKLEETRYQMSQVRKEERLNLGLVVMGIGDVLSEAQKSTLRDTFIRHRGAGDRSNRRARGLKNRSGDPERARGKAQNRRNDRSQGQFRKSEGRRKGKRVQSALRDGRMARILLSDLFLKNLD